MRALHLIPIAILLITLNGCDSGNLSQDEKEEKVELVIQARKYLGEKKYKEAEETYKKAINENPMIARPHLDLAIIYQQHIINHIHAIYHYDRYLELRPETEKKEFINEQRIKIARTLASIFLNASPEVKSLIEQNKKLTEELEKFKTNKLGSASTDQGDKKKSTYTIYHVEKGDTLSRIAQKFYNDPNKWELIYKANSDNLTSPSGIRLGQTLVIPNIDNKIKRNFR